MLTKEVTPARDGSFLLDKVRRFVASSSYDVVRVILGLVLLVAAAFKGHEIATEPIIDFNVLSSDWFLIVLVELEVLFGLWLIVGLYPAWTRRTTILLFAVFACISFYKGISGAESCGCFGNAAISPWWTLGFDIVAVGLLIRYSPSRSCLVSGSSIRSVSVSAIIVMFLWLLLGILGAIAMITPEIAKLNEEGLIVGEGNIVVLEPEKWIDKKFALLTHIDIGDQLSKGKWKIVLFHHDCSKCQMAISRYLEMTDEQNTHNLSIRVAFVEFPPYGSQGNDSQEKCVWARVSEGNDWFVNTPAEIDLQDGIVIKVSYELGTI